MKYFIYIVIKALWAFGVYRDGGRYGMDQKFWTAASFLIPLWVGFFVYFRTRDKVIRQKELERVKTRWPIVETVILAGVLIFLQFR